jgi:hypothetical protein
LVIFALVIGAGLVAEDRAERKETKWIPSHPGWNWKRIFAWVVAAGVIAELFSDAAIWVSSDALQTISDGEILALNAQIAPRRLTTDQQAAIAKELTPFAGKTVMLSSYVLDVEAAVLGIQIRESLDAAHILHVDNLMTVQAGGQIQLAIHISGKDEPLTKGLVSAFGEYQVVTTKELPSRGFSALNFSFPATPPDASIFIGVKPLAK